MLYQLEYPLNSSIKILYERLSTISGLSEWFADDVNINREGIYTFTWEGSSQEGQDERDPSRGGTMPPPCMQDA